MIWIVGGGLAGLSAAVALAEQGRKVTLLEGAPQAGGRCRSYFDPVLGQTIDNGNHLVLSGNTSVQAYLRSIGASDALAGPDRAVFDFVDVRSDKRWTIRPNDSALAWWIFAKDRRVPDTAPSDYLVLVKLLLAGGDKRIDEVIACKGPLWDRLLQPFLLAVLNTEPEASSAKLAGAVIAESLAKGGARYRPRIAHPTLAAAFVDPALKFLAANGADVHLGQRVRALGFEGERLASLQLPSETISVAAGDSVILAVPPWVATELVPGLTAPTEFRSIVNGHFKLPRPAGAPLMTGVIGGAAEWIFAFDDRISITVSGADAIVDDDREALAKRFWADVAKVFHLGPDLPPWQIVKERRATFAATPAQARLRPPPRTRWSNLLLAGDWTDTGLPSTIEGAVRSGHKAAALALARSSL
ncbi:MAG TPA: hydroxysqualene dehydroxylase HpnE [Rhizomicrobium sp.]|jgi:squalene-associated FAD-dependent desaturase|nr:hydroxysqualene dehydroxylase HpnE [Rhizomicrobium sp.]